MMAAAGRRCLAALRIAMSLNVVVLVAGLWCALFGPPWGMWLGVIGFLFVIGAIATHRCVSPNVDADYAEQPRVGVSLIEGVCRIAGVVALLPPVLSFAVMWRDGVPDGAAADHAVFEPRSAYRFNDHGARTDVSRFRFVLAGATFAVAWFGLAMATNGITYGAIHRVVDAMDR